MVFCSSKDYEAAGVARRQSNHDIAQLVEHLPDKQTVGGAIPSIGTYIQAKVCSGISRKRLNPLHLRMNKGHEKSATLGLFNSELHG